MSKVLAGLVVLLCAVSATAQNEHLFYLAMTDNDLSCVGAEVTIGSQMYTVRNGTASQLLGPTPLPIVAGAMVLAKLRWYEGGSCPGPTEDQCTGQFTLAVGTGQVCSKQYGDNEGRILFYTVSQVKSGLSTYWSISFTSSHHTPGPV